VAPEQPYDPRPRPPISARTPPVVQPRTDHGSSYAPIAGASLNDRLITYLQHLAGADGHVRQLRIAYSSRQPNTTDTRRPAAAPDRSVYPERTWEPPFAL
jgi:hypothetical protein